MNVPITYTPTHPVDLVTDGETSAAGITPYRGTSLSKLENEMGPDDAPSCTTTSTTATTVTQSCAEVIALAPQDYLYDAADAGTWKVAGIYGRTTSDNDDSGDHISFGYGYDMSGGLGTTQVKVRGHVHHGHGHGRPRRREVTENGPSPDSLQVAPSPVTPSQVPVGPQPSRIPLHDLQDVVRIPLRFWAPGVEKCPVDEPEPVEDGLEAAQLKTGLDRVAILLAGDEPQEQPQ
ncbi:hypothetical protein [Streptomyces mirabilis]|uniref:hypothetical protein n=1 Tax=Streptomyces mirabilis TaxID=68239 RepID=UPI0037125918